MKENRFIQTREESWNSYKTALEAFEGSRARQIGTSVEEFVNLYRSVSHDLTVARTRHYGANLIERLNELVVRGHNVIYFSRAGWLEKIYRFYAHTFPSEVRKHKKWVFTSLVFFVLPWLAVSYCIAKSDSFIYSIFPEQSVEMFEDMYNPDLRSPNPRFDASQQFAMFGIYIFNNTSIGLLVFVSGIGFGLLTIFVLLSNSVYLGAIFAHLTLIGYGSTLYPFVIGHGAFELTAIVIAGAAGLRLAVAVYFPGQLGRQTALRQGIRETMTLVAGFFTMFLIAAFIEAFWSPWPFPPSIIKYLIGVVLWILVLAYFFFAGRNEISRFAS